MRYVRTGLLIAFGVGLLALPNPMQLRAADSDQQEKDRREIEALMWRYARALDTYDVEAYVANYTPDGQFIAGPNPTAGADALRKMMVGLKTGHDERAKTEPQAPMYHMEMNTYVEFPAKDRARHHSYWQTVFGAVGRGGQVRVAAAGNAVDDLVKVNGKWLIKIRNVSPGSSD